MNDIEVTSIDLVEGGNVFKQGHYLTLGYIPRDENGATVDLSGKTLAVAIWGRKGIVFESVATYSGGVIRFTLNETVPAADDYKVEFTVTSSTDEKYRKKFPTNKNAGRISIQQSADDLGVIGISVYTVDRLKKEQQEAQVAYQSTVDSKVLELETEFDAAVGAVTVDSEVVIARGNEPTLNQRLQRDNAVVTAQLAEKAEKDALEAERSRIDSFTTLAAGSTTGDAELIDGRVGADGKTYTNIGGAIRGQIANTETEITEFKNDVSVFVKPKNLLNTSDADFVINKYISPTTGVLTDSTTYNTSGFIQVVAGKKIIRTVTNGGLRSKVTMRFIAAYNSAGEIMSTSGSSDDVSEYIVPTGVAILRISYTNRTDFTDNMISMVDSADASVPAFEAYFAPYYKTVVATDKTLSKANEPADAKEVGDALGVLNGSVSPYKNPAAVKKAATLAASAIVSIPEYPEMLKTGQRFSYTAKFTAFATSDIIKIGFIKEANTTYQSWLEISATHVKWMLSGTNAILSQAHGLTLSDFVNATININPATAKVELFVTSLGGTYTFKQTVDSTRLNAIGILTGQATMATNNVVLSGTCTQFKYDTWLIGDSYFGDGSNRIGGRLVEWGFAGDVLLDGLGGLNSQYGYEELQRMLNYGTPKTLVWYLGMNDDSTSVNTYFPLVEQLCDENGIELVFNRIPFVPSRLANNAAVNDYVLASGKRYIDSYSAVGADANGNWYAGHLNADGVHPDPLGAAALTSRMLSDAPEILSASIS